VVPEGAHVTLHYNGYKEYYDEPFDSTYLRRIPLRLRLGQGKCIMGFEEAVLTMRKGETSKFMIHPDLAYGQRGCEPRIPKSNIFHYDIHNVKIIIYLLYFFRCNLAL
jgi:FK506-binding protein 6